MIQNALKNWKTTSAGIGLIITAVVHLIFTHKTADENTWTTSLLSIMAGVGLIAAGDATASAAAHQESTEAITKLQEQAGQKPSDPPKSP